MENCIHIDIFVYIHMYILIVLKNYTYILLMAVSGGTEHQSFCMEPNSTTLE